MVMRVFALTNRILGRQWLAHYRFAWNTFSVGKVHINCGNFFFQCSSKLRYLIAHCPGALRTDAARTLEVERHTPRTITQHGAGKRPS